MLLDPRCSCCSLTVLYCYFVLFFRGASPIFVWFLCASLICLLLFAGFGCLFNFLWVLAFAFNFSLGFGKGSGESVHLAHLFSCFLRLAFTQNNNNNNNNFIILKFMSRLNLTSDLNKKNRYCLS